MTNERFSGDYLDAAHKHSFRNRKEVEASEVCGCFCCLATFHPSKVDDWVEEGWVAEWVEEDPSGSQEPRGVTALCPACGIDSVLGSASGLPVADEEFLGRMRAVYFWGSSQTGA